VLSGLAACAAITAAVAGVTGAWSPCGFSMVETIGSALGDARRGATLVASATFALGTLIGGVVTFAGLALAGSLIGGGVDGLRAGLGAAIALAAAVADWRGVRIAPQIRRQVPERWRWTMPLPLACALYGVLLGLGFTTFVLAFAVWALAGISFAAGDPLLGAIIGLAFGAGRALPVLWMAPGLRGGRGARRLDEMAGEPRLWLGLRRLDALGLLLCALVLGAAGASAATLPAATDPSAAAGELAWQEPGGPGMLLALAGSGGSDARASSLPGEHPAIGGSLVAWTGAGEIVVADRATLTPRLTLAAPGVNALAVSNGWLVFRAVDGAGGEQLVAQSLAAPPQRRYVYGARLAGEVGRPSLDEGRVVFAVGTPAHSAIELVDLLSARVRTLRAVGYGAALSNPSLLGGRLLFDRVTRCAQQLRLGPALADGSGRARHGPGAIRERTLLSLPSTVARDPGYERGYTHAYNGASRCRNRRAGPGGNTQLGSTALSASTAYVSEFGTTGGNASIVSVGF
jgi:hypothetical protein